MNERRHKEKDLPRHEVRNDFYCDDNACWGERKCKKQCAMCVEFE